MVVEAVSVMPYPSRISTPKRFSKASSTGAGMDAPPEIATRSDDTS